uniref:Carboxylesterase type B domain-containing protein n=1 Tax=Tetranychus urticae TaxID=32264 RepID=T1L027_TETUR
MGWTQDAQFDRITPIQIRIAIGSRVDMPNAVVGSCRSSICLPLEIGVDELVITASVSNPEDKNTIRIFSLNMDSTDGDILKILLYILSNCLFCLTELRTMITVGILHIILNFRASKTPRYTQKQHTCCDLLPFTPAPGAIVLFYQFLGIPFAEPPLNELRFQKPVPKKPWNGVLSMNKWGSACMQPIFPGFNTELPISEDCLILNVFTTEAAFQDRKNGKKNKLHVIIVSLNYRLGSLRFLQLPEAGVPGNMDLWDQQLTLQLGKYHIIHFGGDPDELTIFGEPAGSMSVSANLVSSKSKGLFKNIFHYPKSFSSKIGCTSNDYKSCLSNCQFNQFPAADELKFWPTVDSEFFPNHPEELVSNHGLDQRINVLLGIVGNEGTMLCVVSNVYGHVQTQRSSHAVLPVSNQAKWMSNVASHADTFRMVFGHPFTKHDKLKNEDVVCHFS